MTISYIDAGTTDYGTTPLVPAYPSGFATGDLLVLHVTNKPETAVPTTPAGWTLEESRSGGSGSAGADSGDVLVSVYTKTADGTESGTLSVTITGANSARAKMYAYTSSNTSALWLTDSADGVDSTAGTGWSVSTGAISVQPDDLVLAFSGINTDLGNATTEALAMSGVTFGTMVERDDASISTGNDLSMVASEHPVTAGTVSAAATFTMTWTASGANYPAGATVLLRLRESSNVTADFWVEGISETIALDRWSVTFNTTPVVDLFPDGVWVLGTSELNNDAYLGF